MDDDPDMIHIISGHDVIMAYEGSPKYYVQHSSDRRVCTCLFWTRYTLFVFNFLVWAAGVTMIGIGAWAVVNGPGLELFESLMAEPSWMLIGIGIVMVIVGVFGCAASLRLNVICLRVFMAAVVVVFVLQLVLAAVVFFRMDDLKHDMLTIMKEAVIHYQVDRNLDRDKALDYLQREFTCCGATSFSDWEANIYYNCSTVTSATRCGVPSSCCRGSRDPQCGSFVRHGTEGYTEMFAYTEGCMVELLDIFRENIVIIAVLAFSICLVEIGCIILANIIIRHIVYQRKLLP